MSDEADPRASYGPASHGPASRVGLAAIVPLVLALSATSLRNQWRRRLARLRRPRYLLALLAGGAYLWFAIFRHGRTAELGTLITPAAEPLAALALLALAATWWLSPEDQQALAFTPAEAYLLFPAPVSRRALLLWKVFRAQGTILVGTVVWVALVRGGAAPSAWLRAIALWTLFSTMHLHRLGVQLAHAARFAHDEAAFQAAGAIGEPPAARRGWRPVAAIAALGLLVGVGIIGAVPVIRAAQGASETGAALARALAHPAARVALFPSAVASGALFADHGLAWVARVVPALLLLLLHYTWVLARDVPFEEGAMAATEARTARHAARRGQAPRMRARHVSAWLTPRGHPAVAIAWKNILGWLRTVRPGPVLIAIVTFGAFNIMLSGGRLTPSSMMMPLAVAIGVLLVLFGPLIVRSDLRQDLSHLDQLRSWPLSGAATVAAEVGGATAILLVLQLGFALLVLATLAATSHLSMPSPSALLLVVAALAGITALDAAHLTLHNLTAVLFPDWVRPDRERIGGLETTGQGMILMVVLLVALLLLLLLPLVAGGAVTVAVLMAARGITDADVMLAMLGELPAGAILGGVATFALLLLGEAALLMRWAGRALDRTEPADAR